MKTEWPLTQKLLSARRASSPFHCRKLHPSVIYDPRRYSSNPVFLKRYLEKYYNVVTQWLRETFIIGIGAPNLCIVFNLYLISK